MRYARVCIDSFGYELPPHVVTSAALDDRLAPLYQALRLPPRQIEPLTGVRERRFWAPGQRMSDAAIKAARKALAGAQVTAQDVGLLIYGGVCRDYLEPATACAVADGLGLRGRAEVYDVSNACLGVVNGMVQVANAIELGYARAGLIVSCESAREIVDATIARLCAQPNMDTFKLTLATLTGGSGAVAVLLADTALTEGRRRLLGGVARAAPQYYRLCSWASEAGAPTEPLRLIETDAVAIMQNGVQLGAATWRDFLRELEWPDGPDKIVCHQVGAANRDALLKAIRFPPERDFPTFPFLGNIGTVSLPITAAIAEERGFLEPGERVGFLGIGSGLNCVMLGIEW